jgi:hypothetical protein
VASPRCPDSSGSRPQPDPAAIPIHRHRLHVQLQAKASGDSATPRSEFQAIHLAG